MRRFRCCTVAADFLKGWQITVVNDECFRIRMIDDIGKTFALEGGVEGHCDPA